MCGYLGEKVDWHLGFCAAGFGMVIGLIQYRFGEKYLGEAGTLKDSEASRVSSATKKLWIGVVAIAASIGALAVLAEPLGLTLETTAAALGVGMALLGVVYFGAIIGFGGLTSREKKRVFVIFLLFVGAALFWSGFEQAGSSMNLFAERHTDRTGPLISLVLGLSLLTLIFALLRKGENQTVLAWLLAAELGITAGIACWWAGLGTWAAVGATLVGTAVVFGAVKGIAAKILRPTLLALTVAQALALIWWAFGPGQDFSTPASWLQSVNPLFIIVFAPVFAWLWVALGNREPSIPFKFGIGLALLGFGFLVLASGSNYITASAAGVTPWWLIATYFLHTAGELCLSPVGLSSVTKLSPHRLVGQMMGTWFMGAALGNLIAGLVAGRIETLPLPQLFGTVATIVIVSGVVFMVFTIPIKKLIGNLDEDDEHLQQVPIDEAT